VTYVPVVQPDLRLEADRLPGYLSLASPRHPHLFAFPAQSNYSGVQHPLEMIGEAQARGWDVLVDGAAFAPTNLLDLSRWHPDFVPLSFYKMFGYPTGVGCLLARKPALEKLRRPWFAGGTITIASVQGDGHHLAPGEAGFEDGTINYLNLPAIEIGLRHVAACGLETIHQRVVDLTGWLLESLLSLRHENGEPLVRIHGPRDTRRRGGTMTLDLYDRRGRPFDGRRLEEMANRANISVRTGCFCNPGAGEVAHGLTEREMKPFFQAARGMSYQELADAMLEKYGKNVSSIRVSVGLASNFADVYRFVAFARGFLDRTVEEVGGVAGGYCGGVARDSS
jgi:selenocysteine lyase/cysteine desulfurase